NAVGQQISIQTVSYDATLFQATLSYNNGNNLTAQKYTLFVEGDNIVDTDGDNLPISHSRQLAVAGGPNGIVSIVNVPGDGTLQALSNYASNPQQVASAAPVWPQRSDLPLQLVLNKMDLP